MKKIIISFIIILSLFSNSIVHAEKKENWTKKDICLEVAWECLEVMDWGTSRNIIRRKSEGYYETNLILGKHPSMTKMDLYCIGWMIIHPIVTNYLPRPYKEYWQYSSIVISGGYVANNFSIGLKLTF